MRDYSVRHYKSEKKHGADIIEGDFRLPYCEIKCAWVLPGGTKNTAHTVRTKTEAQRFARAGAALMGSL